MSELARILPFEDFEHRLQLGAVAPLEGLRVVDCGDERPLTELSYRARETELGAYSTPGRFFGGAVGLGVVTLVAISAEYGEAAVTSYVDNFGPEAIVDLSADLAQRTATMGVRLTIHSSDGSEGNDRDFADHHIHSNPLGCAFCANCGGVVHTAASSRALQDARLIASVAGETPTYAGSLETVASGAKVLAGLVMDKLSVHRGAVHHAVTKKTDALRTPILAGSHAPNDVAAVTYDFAGVRASAHRMAQLQTPRYHHTLGIAEYITQLTPEISIDPNLMRASALLVGAATRIALSGPETPDALKAEVIPAAYSKQITS